MLSYFNFENRKNIIFILFIFIILFDISLLKTLDNFKYENLDNGDLIYVKDYHNLSLKITTSKKLYIDFPPSLKFNLSASITRYSNAITYNNKFVFITCLEDDIVKGINLENGNVFHLNAQVSITHEMCKSCPISIAENFVFIIYSSKYTNYTSSTILQFKLEDNDDNNGPSIPDLPNPVLSFDYEPIEVDQQIDLEIISLYEDKNDMFLIYFYVSPESVNGETKYNLMADIYGKTKVITSSNVVTGIKAYKLNYYTIRCIIKYKQIDLIIKKEGSEYDLVEVINNYNICEEELISYSNDLTFLASGTYIKIIKTNYQNYYIFSIKSTIKEIIGIYNETLDYIVVYYKTENSLNYISFQNSSFYFQIKTSSYKYIKEYNDNNKVVNIKEALIPNDDYENIKLSRILYEGGNITDEYYTYKELSTELTIFGNPKKPEIKAIFIFNYLYEKQSNIDINLNIDPPINITIEFEGCSFYCNLCFYHYKDCNLQNCINNYAFIKNSDDCYPINQLFKKYI